MTRPSRATVSGRAYLDLLARARREGRPADELLTLYVLERFLYRLSVSDHRDRLVLKGGMLLSAFGQRRPTRDIDLLAKSTSHEPAAVAALVADIAVIDADDGVTTIQSIRPALMCGRLSRSRLAACSHDHSPESLVQRSTAINVAPDEHDAIAWSTEDALGELSQVRQRVPRHADPGVRRNARLEQAIPVGSSATPLPRTPTTNSAAAPQPLRWPCRARRDAA